MNLETTMLLQQLERLPEKHAQLRALDSNARPDFVRFMIKSNQINDSFDLNKVEWDLI